MIENLVEHDVLLYHAVQLNDFKTYIDNNAILSRKILSEKNRNFTRFFSDPKDYRFDCWNRTFGNFSDFGQGFANFNYSVPNAYGPINIVLKSNVLQTLDDLKFTTVSISQEGFDPDQHEIENVIDCFDQSKDRWYPGIKYYGLEFSTSNETIPLDSIAYILIDHIEFKDIRFIDVIKNEAEELDIGPKQLIERNMNNVEDKKKS